MPRHPEFNPPKQEKPPIPQNAMHLLSWLLPYLGWREWTVDYFIDFLHKQEVREQLPLRNIQIHKISWWSETEFLMKQYYYYSRINNEFMMEECEKAILNKDPNQYYRYMLVIFLSAENHRKTIKEMIQDFLLLNDKNFSVFGISVDYCDVATFPSTVVNIHNTNREITQLSISVPLSVKEQTLSGY